MSILAHPNHLPKTTSHGMCGIFTIFDECLLISIYGKFLWVNIPFVPWMQWVPEEIRPSIDLIPLVRLNKKTPVDLLQKRKEKY